MPCPYERLVRFRRMLWTQPRRLLGAARCAPTPEQEGVEMSLDAAGRSAHATNLAAQSRNWPTPGAFGGQAGPRGLTGEFAMACRNSAGAGAGRLQLSLI